ncbi:MAG: SDR family oxidoreductase [Anaerolineae bacterium]|nr:SDR family oxidoreductase [Anaerolineae bacterium]
MRVLFIGGTGNISTDVSKLALQQGIELYHLNRGKTAVEIPGVTSLVADIHQPTQVRTALDGLTFDAIVNWIAFIPADVEQDIALFAGKTTQYIFISSASAYQKPPAHPVITESTPLHNPYWQYARNKIACERRLEAAFRDEGFPAVIVRPSLTYANVFPVAIGGWKCYTLADRLLKGRTIIVHGDGSSLWTVTDARDFAKGFVGLLGNPQTLGHAFHITSDELLTWNQIYKTIAGALDVEADIVHIPSDFIAKVSPATGAGLLGDKAWSCIFDNTKIKTFVPTFQATIPFREGIRRTLSWFEEDERRKWINPDVSADIDKILAAYAAATRL